MDERLRPRLKPVLVYNEDVDRSSHEQFSRNDLNYNPEPLSPFLYIDILSYHPQLTHRIRMIKLPQRHGLGRRG